MIYQSNCKQYKYILHVENKTDKQIDSLFSDTMQNNLSISNQFIVINHVPSNRVTSIAINRIYHSNKCYSNGNVRTKNSFQVMLQNMLSNMNKLDHAMVFAKAWIGDPYLTVLELLRYYHENDTYNNHEEIQVINKVFNLDLDLDMSSHFFKAPSNTVYMTVDRDSIALKIRKYESLFSLKYKHCYFTDKRVTYNRNIRLHCGIGVYGDNSRWIARTYFEDNVTFCDCCNYVDIFDNIISHEDNEYNPGDYENVCHDCHERHLEDRFSESIHSYSYKPKAWFYRWDNNRPVCNREPKDKLNIGFELEILKKVDCSINEMHQVAQEINDLGLFYCKTDSSIGGSGFEIVSHPMTFECARKLDLNSMIFRHQDKFKSFRTRSCGMHIHVSRKAFNDMQLYKFVLMLNEYKNFTHFISQRRDTREYRNWSNFIDGMHGKIKTQSSSKYKYWMRNKDTDNKFKLKYQADVDYGSRYQVVNLQNRQTIEIRCFKGNLSENGFRKNLEFVESLYYFCKDTSLQDLNINSYVKYVRNDAKYYKELNDFFRRNNNTLGLTLKNPTELTQ